MIYTSPSRATVVTRMLQWIQGADRTGRKERKQKFNVEREGLTILTMQI
jgi:hypothetical protein